MQLFLFWKSGTEKLFRKTDQLSKAGLGSTEGFVSTIIHVIVLLPLGTLADGSPNHPFQKTQLSQLDYFMKSFLSGT